MTTDMVGTIVGWGWRGMDNPAWRRPPSFLFRTPDRGGEKRKDALLDASHRTGPHIVGMLIGWVVLLIALAGLVIYVTASKPKAEEIGRLMFACGLLALCFVLAGKTVRLL